MAEDEKFICAEDTSITPADLVRLVSEGSVKFKQVEVTGQRACES
jgi:hypothetical protein